MDWFHFIITATICLSIFYVFYILILKDRTDFKSLRFYLLASILMSLFIPQSNLRVHIDIPENQQNLQRSLVENSIMLDQQDLRTKSNDSMQSVVKKSEVNTEGINRVDLIKKLYLLIAGFLIARIIFQIMTLAFQYLKSKKEKEKGFTLIYSPMVKSSFSFFSWIFLAPDISSDEDKIQIITHERIHASQYHSCDLILVELMTATMWFNPLIWMMRKSVQLVHEYLADKGVLDEGIDKFRYQALLVNIISEERLISLSSSFNKSLIKKRMTMMNKQIIFQRSGYGLLTIIPLAVILVFGVACIKGKESSNVLTAVELVKMNVLYIGVDNPVKIAAAGFESDELEVSIDNGTISGKDGEYLIRPSSPGRATLIVRSNGEEFQKTEFRVKEVPDPVAAIESENRKLSFSGGSISKEELLAAGGLQVQLRNFDYDLSFKVVSFVLSATVPNSLVVREEISNSDRFSDTQVNLINSLIMNQKLMFEEIIAVGPDGTKRKLNSMVFTIKPE